MVEISFTVDCLLQNKRLSPGENIKDIHSDLDKKSELLRPKPLTSLHQQQQENKNLTGPTYTKTHYRQKIMLKSLQCYHSQDNFYVIT